MLKHNTEPDPAQEFAAFLALDWADQEHAFRLQVVGQSKIETGTLEQKPAVLGPWVAKLRERCAAAQEIVFQVLLPASEARPEGRDGHQVDDDNCQIEIMHRLAGQAILPQTPSITSRARGLTRLPWISGAFCRKFAGSPVCPRFPPRPQHAIARA